MNAKLAEPDRRSLGVIPKERRALILAPMFVSLLQYATCEVPMAFLIRPSRRFPVCCPVTYQCGLFEGHGTVWNLSLMGWCFSGNLPLRVGEVCSLTVNLPTQARLYVSAGIVR